MLKQFGVPFEVLDPAGCIAAEPALAKVRGKFVGGLRLPGDETGDCKMFTERLAEHAAGARRHLPLRHDDRAAGRPTAAASPASRPAQARSRPTPMSWRSAAIRRCCCGRSASRSPVYPIKGYSITVPITDAAGAPESTVMDETYKVAITRLGDRIRVGGTAEISGYDLQAARGAARDAGAFGRRPFPGRRRLSRASFWCGLRPMTPDGPPIIGGTRVPNLYLNTGHGTLGWTMACGSGRVLADLISGRKPEIEIGALGISRYG